MATTTSGTLRGLRQRRGLTQTEVCVSLGISISYLRTLESGAMPLGKSEALTRLADFYGVPVDSLHAPPKGAVRA